MKVHETTKDSRLLLCRTAFHLLYPEPVLGYRLFHKWRGCLDVTELAFFWSHFLSWLPYWSQVLLAKFYCFIVLCTCFYNDIKVHNPAILFCYVRVIDCAFHVIKMEGYVIYSISPNNARQTFDICLVCPCPHVSKGLDASRTRVGEIQKSNYRTQARKGADRLLN